MRSALALGDLVGGRAAHHAELQRRWVRLRRLLQKGVELRIPPYFPNSELYKDQQGFALVRYDINVKGATENIEVLIDWPGGIFTEKAVKAVSKWKYSPPTDPQGKVGRIEDIETMIRYIIR
ncbi:MAG: TonB family protein [Nitrospira sp.]|nr:TonB family protein [Nitrospira sp.]